MAISGSIPMQMARIQCSGSKGATLKMLRTDGQDTMPTCSSADSANVASNGLFIQRPSAKSDLADLFLTNAQIQYRVQLLRL